MNSIRKNNYYTVFYEKKWEGLLELGYIEINSKNQIILVASVFKENFDQLLEFGYTRYEILAFIKSPIYSVYFRNELLAQYLNNPNYHFFWNHYRGSIVATDEVNDDEYFKNICLGYDLFNNAPITMMFVGDVLKLDFEHQRYIERFEIKKRDHLVLNQEVINNLIYGKRSKIENSDIYNVIIIGMKLLNEIFESSFNLKLFREIKDYRDYEYFRPIFITSKLNYYLFVLELYKLIFDNISIKTLKHLIVMKTPICKDELNDQKLWPRGRITKESLGESNNLFLKKLSDIRNIPAHKIYENELNKKYWHEQDKLLIETYIFINSLIVEFSNSSHKEKIDYYEGLFGKDGKISTGNSFNQTPYIYYDGQIRLICEIFGQKDAEYMIAFKTKEDMVLKLTNYISSIREDLNEETIKYLTDRILNQEAKTPDKEIINSFFKGYYLKKSIYEPENYNKEEYIKLGEQAAIKFMSRYPIENIFVIADTTDPNFSSFENCTDEIDLVGKGYVTELMHYFKEDYKYDNVITNPTDDVDIQVLSNIWD